MIPHDELRSTFDGERYLKVPVRIIDKRAFWRDCLIQCLNAAEADLTADGFDEVEDWIKAPPDDGSAIVLLCVVGQRATELAVEHDLDGILQARPETKVVIVSDMDGPATMVSALERGARGFLTMSLSLDVTIEAIRIIKVGGTFVPASGLFGARDSLASAPELASSAQDGHPHFTERQLAIIACVRKGEPNKIIAHKLNMTESTVKVHIRNIMRKIKAKNRTEVAFLTNELTLPNESPPQR